MSHTSMRALLAPLVALATAAAGCAHLPRSGDALLGAGAPGADARADRERPEKVLVTGSRIPRRVDPRTGLPETFSPVRIHTRHDLLHAGVAGDLGAVLYRLDPAIAIGP